jgi:NDP-sugar pyrophosphorylase family protein
VPAGVRDVLVLMGDMPMVSTGSMRKIIDLHLRTQCVITIATAMLDDPSGYGRVVRSFSGKVIGIKEDRDCADSEKDVKEVNTGVYCFSLPQLRASIPKLRNDNAKKEYYLTDLVHMAASEPTGNVSSVRIPPEEANGINDRYQASEAERTLMDRLLRQLMRDGVSILRPETVYIENAARISPDTVLEPSVMVKGKTAIGKACVIGAGSILKDTVVEDQAVVGPYCILEGATVRSGSRLEPFTKMLRSAEKQPQGRGQSRGQGRGRGQVQDQAQGQGQVQDQGKGRGQGQVQSQVQGQPRGQGQPRSQGQGQPRSQGQGQPQGQDQGQPQGQDQGQPQGQVQVQDQAKSQGQVQGQGQGKRRRRRRRR